MAIVYRDKTRDFGAIGEFIPDNDLRKLASHFEKNAEKNLPSIMYGGRSDLKFTETFVSEHPESVEARLSSIQAKHPNVVELGPGEEYELKTSTFDVLTSVFFSDEPVEKDSYYRILGISGTKRVFRWVERRYMTPRYPNNNNVDKYKVAVAKACGNDIIGMPIVLGPMESMTPSFISIGKFDTEQEAINACKYIKSKLVRALLTILKITQDITPSKWAYVPLQDFTPASDIDWSASIPEIDRQLYRKYGLDGREIDFIGTHVKEMN